MMTAMTKFLTSAVFGLTMLSAGGAEAKPVDGGRGAAMCERLVCSDAQKAQLKQIREATRAKVKAERTAIRELKQQIAAEYRKDRLDQARLAALYRQLDTRKGTVEGHRRAMRAEVHGVLTPEQRAKFADMRARHGKHKQGGKGRGRGGRNGQVRGI